MMMNLYRKQHGLSMIELMVAMALSLILMAGVLQIFISNKKSFEITRDLSDVQENGRLGLTFIGESIRNADHWGAIEGKDLSNGAAVTGVDTTCDSAWILNTDVAIQGFEGAANAPIDCIQNATTNYLANTDVLVVRYADGREMVAETDVAGLAVSAANSVYTRVLTAEQGRVFNGADVAAALAAIPTDVAVLTFPFTTELYYVRRCSITNGGVCDADLDDTPTLVRMTLNGNQFEEQTLVEGVEQLQFEYGIDTDDTDSALITDTYVTAGTAPLNTEDGWNDVLSVRMSLVARATQLDIQVDDGKTYELAGNFDHTADPALRQFRRKQYNREINLRNRSRL